MEITNEMILQASTILALDDMSSFERDAVIAELGNSILENVLLTFFANQSEWEQESFSEWVTRHAGEPDMLEQLITLYPNLGTILAEEIILLKTTLASSQT